MKKISLLGCGKLGYPLAIKLLNKGYTIKGSTTSMAKSLILKNAGIIPYIINVEQNMDLDFFNSDIIVLTLPYKKSFPDPYIYKVQIEKICNHVKKSSIKHIIFTSSSSVYPKNGKNYLSSDAFLPDTKRAKTLLNCEHIIQSNNNISSIIIRLGGIFGDKRNVKPSNKKRRLIKETDAIDLIMNSIDRFGENDIINGFKQVII